MINRVYLKSAAKKINRESVPSVYTVAVIYVIVAELLAYLANRMVAPNLSTTTLQNLQNAAAEGNLNYVTSVLEKYAPSNFSYGIEMVLMILNVILAAGFYIFMINTIRKNKPEIQNLLDGFGIGGKVILVSFLKWLFTTLLGFLFIIPGIIAAYSYRQATYLLIDHPDWSVMQCIRESRRIMKGHKWELFVLDLSFLGWNILTAIVFPIRIYTEPYIQGTYILFYQSIAAPELMQNIEFTQTEIV